MANQTANYHDDYQWNYTISSDEGDTETRYYLPNWTDLILAGLFTTLIIVTIVSNYSTTEIPAFSRQHEYFSHQNICFNGALDA